MEKKPEVWRIGWKDDHDAQQANAAGLQLPTAWQHTGSGNNNAAHERNEKQRTTTQVPQKTARTDLRYDQSGGEKSEEQCATNRMLDSRPARAAATSRRRQGR